MEWATSEDFADEVWRELQASSRGPVIACEVFDSDGGRLNVFDNPNGHWTTYLNLRGFVSHQLPPLVPFDADGNMLDDASARVMDAEYEIEFDAGCARLLASVATGLNAAERALSW